MSLNFFCITFWNERNWFYKHKIAFEFTWPYLFCYFYLKSKISIMYIKILMLAINKILKWINKLIYKVALKLLKRLTIKIIAKDFWNFSKRQNGTILKGVLNKHDIEENLACKFWLDWLIFCANMITILYGMMIDECNWPVIVANMNTNTILIPLRNISKSVFSILSNNYDQTFCR